MSRLKDMLEEAAQRERILVAFPELNPQAAPQSEINTRTHARTHTHTHTHTIDHKDGAHSCHQSWKAGSSSEPVPRGYLYSVNNGSYCLHKC